MDLTFLTQWEFWTIFIAGLALLLSVLSPIITVIFNNKHQRKIYDMDLKQKQIDNVIENYVIEASMIVISGRRSGHIDPYGATVGPILLLVSGELREDIINLNNLIISDTIGIDTLSALYKICNQLQEEFPRPK